MVPINRITKSLIDLTRHLSLKLSLLVLLVSLFLATPSLFAQTNTTPDPCEVFGNCLTGTQNYANESADSIVVGLVLGFSYFLIYVGTAIAVLFIVFGGYKLISANGNDSEIKSGRSMITNAIIGLVLIIVSVTIVRVVTVFVTGVQIPGLFG